VPALPAYKEHPYRRRVHPHGLISYRVLIKETDLLVSSSRDLSKQAKAHVHSYRGQIEEYIQHKPDFLTTLLPYPEDPFAPAIVKTMISAARMFNVGPMAAVAGAIAEFVGQELLKYTEEIIVENGGDIFLKTNRPITASIFAGTSQFSDKIGVIIHPGQMPTGICTSSASVGHSLSLGIADAVCIIAKSASVADAAATALGNKITNKFQLKKEIDIFRESKDIKGGVVIVGKTMATWGEVELAKLDCR